MAPFLGTLIGGPFGAAAGKVIGSVLCGDEEASEEKIAEAINNASPQTLLKLRQADNEYKAQMAKIGLDEKKLAMLDRDSARNRQIKTNDKLPSVLAVMLTLGFFGVLTAIMFYSVPKEIQQTLDILLGFLGGGFMSVITYYFGSSASSRRKSELFESARKD